MRECFEVQDEGNGYLSIWRGDVSFGCIMRRCVMLVTFDGPPSPNDWPMAKGWIYQHSPMPMSHEDRRLRAPLHLYRNMI